MQKIMHLITGLNTGGAEIMLLKLLTHSDRLKYESIVVSMLDKGTIGSRIENLGIKVYTLNMKRGIPSFTALKELLSIIKTEKPEVLQTWLYHADLMGLVAAKLCNIKHLVWNVRCSNMELKKYSITTTITIKLLTYLSKYPGAVIVNSETGQEIHKKMGYNPQKWIKIDNGFETEKFKPCSDEEKNNYKKSIGLNQNDILIGMAARYDPMKGHSMLIEAAYSLFKTDKAENVFFLMAGRYVTWENFELVTQIQKYQLRNNFILLGERIDIQNILPCLDIYVSPSLGEGFPNAIGEAMCSGIPCIATDVGDCARIVDKYGIIVPSANIQALTNALKDMIAIGPSKRRELGSEARKHIIRNYDIKKIVKDYEAFYDSLREINSKGKCLGFIRED